MAIGTSQSPPLQSETPFQPQPPRAPSSGRTNISPGNHNENKNHWREKGTSTSFALCTFQMTSTPDFVAASPT
eukprot:1642751-Rhodomonas_salina.1